MASYWQSLKKPLTSSGFMNTKMYSSSVGNMSAGSKKLHLSAKQDYPQAEALPLPPNIDVTESMRFSPQRARDINSTALATNLWNQRVFDITIDSSHVGRSAADPHVDSYDCNGAVSLNSSMQSNVPSPFGGMHKFTHLNMPGGQWSQSSKWMSQDLHSSHYTNLRREVRQNMLENELKANSVSKKGMIVHKTNGCMHGKSSKKFNSNAMWMQINRSNSMRSFACLNQINHVESMFCHLNVKSNQIIHRTFSDKKASSETNKEPKEEQTPSDAKTDSNALTPRAKLKNAVKDYGATVIVFHVAISLASLGIFYQLVSR